jgi:hypothetical protein
MKDSQVSVDRLVVRWPVVRPFFLVGAVCVIAGGITAAVTRPTAFELGSWLAAYLVLVGGVAQITLGAGQAWVAVEPPGQRIVTAEIAAWNVGIVCTIVGTLVGAPVVTTLGGVASVVALGTFIRAVRNADAGFALIRTIYRWVTAIVLIGIPVGLALAWIRHG